MDQHGYYLLGGSPQIQTLYGEFDPGSGQTLAACLIHASRTGTFLCREAGSVRVADG